MSLLGNAVLRSLPPSEAQRLSPYFQRVSLTAGETLFGPGDFVTRLWFPECGGATRLIQIGDGDSVEVGMVGSDGVAGFPVALGTGVENELGVSHCVVQIPGTALVITNPDFDEHVRRTRSPLLNAMLVYASRQITIVSRLAACHCLHRIEQRLVRCLLTLDDHNETGDLRITHDTLAAFLGVHRPSVTYALQALAETGVLSLSRRRIVLLDRDALALTVCECYTVIKRISATPIPQP